MSGFQVKIQDVSTSPAPGLTYHWQIALLKYIGSTLLGQNSGTVAHQISQDINLSLVSCALLLLWDPILDHTLHLITWDLSCPELLRLVFNILYVLKEDRIDIQIILSVLELSDVLMVGLGHEFVVDEHSGIVCRHSGIVCICHILLKVCTINIVSHQ